MSNETNTTDPSAVVDELVTDLRVLAGLCVLLFHVIVTIVHTVSYWTRKCCRRNKRKEESSESGKLETFKQDPLARTLTKPLTPTV